MEITPRAQSFASVAEHYALGRPPYPAGVVSELERRAGLRPGAAVVDLAAGTGKLTRRLRTSGARVTAVEPLDAMRAWIVAERVLAGTAEAIPVPDAGADLVCIGDAWHWFDAPAAAAELARVVRPGGHVALLWQTPVHDGEPDWATAVYAILGEICGDHPFHAGDGGVPVLDRHPAFTGLERSAVRWTWTPTRDEVVAYVCSTSAFAIQPPDVQARVLERVPALLPAGPLETPYATEVCVTQRR